MTEQTKDLLALADTLEWHQKWRQSNNEGPMLHPRILTEALDDAIKFIRASATSAPVQTTLEQAVTEVVARHGGVRATERATGLDKSFISRLMRGAKTHPSDETLKKLGLKAVPLYVKAL